MDHLEIFNTKKFYRQGDAINTCFSLCIWGIYTMLGMIIYAGISSNNMIAMPFLMISCITFLILCLAVFLIFKDH